MRAKLSFVDKVLDEIQYGLATCHAQPVARTRPYPGNKTELPSLSDEENLHVAGLMRVNNAGEVAAQGLYRGQALTARNNRVSASMLAAAEEENEHLNWCQNRLSELGENRSKLDGIWYWGSFSIGALAGLAGDKWSLGFVQETENQVCRHLDQHLSQLPVQDTRSREKIETMKIDEMAHSVNAQEAAREAAAVYSTGHDVYQQNHDHYGLSSLACVLHESGDDC